MGFCWLWGLDLWAWLGSMASPSVWPWVMGVTVGLAVGCGCHRRFGRGSWVSLLVWSWVVGRGCGVGFFLLGLLGSDGGSLSGYSGGSVVGCACVMGCRLICDAGLVMLWVTV